LRDTNILIFEKAEFQSWWLIPVILATQEAEVRRITVQSQPRQIVLKTLHHKKKKKIPNTKQSCQSGPSGKVPS
jgi:hypothetical protein